MPGAGRAGQGRAGQDVRPAACGAVLHFGGSRRSGLVPGDHALHRQAARVAASRRWPSSCSPAARTMTTSADNSATASKRATPRSGPCPRTGWATSGRPADASSRCAATPMSSAPPRATGSRVARRPTTSAPASSRPTMPTMPCATTGPSKTPCTMCAMSPWPRTPVASAAPGVFAQLRTCALNLLRQAGHDNIRAARQTTGWSEQRCYICAGSCSGEQPWGQPAGRRLAGPRTVSPRRWA